MCFSSVPNFFRAASLLEVKIISNIYWFCVHWFNGAMRYSPRVEWWVLGAPSRWAPSWCRRRASVLGHPGGHPPAGLIPVKQWRDRSDRMPIFRRSRNKELGLKSHWALVLKSSITANYVRCFTYSSPPSFTPPMRFRLFFRTPDVFSGEQMLLRMVATNPRLNLRASFFLKS